MVMLDALDRLSERPRAKAMVASVAMNGEIPANPIRMPLRRPMSAPLAIAVASVSTADPEAAWTRPAATPAKASVLPTEISMPRAMMTAVIAKAIRAITELC